VPSSERAFPVPAGPSLILASASPRRRELLERLLGADRLAVLAPDLDEAAVTAACLAASHKIPAGSSRQESALILADQLPAEKLSALRRQFVLPETYVALAADTLVVLDGQILGKPVDKDDAVRMLRLLSGRSHEVLTGICLTAQDGGERCDLRATEKTCVRFAPLGEEQIRWYAQTGEPLDKAGAYGIQGYGAALVESIDGCYYNVMGLPVHRLLIMLRQVADHFSSNPFFSHLLPWF
jgi:septum formation protein